MFSRKRFFTLMCYGAEIVFTYYPRSGYKVFIISFSLIFQPFLSGMLSLSYSIVSILHLLHSSPGIILLHVGNCLFYTAFIVASVCFFFFFTSILGSYAQLYLKTFNAAQLIHPSHHVYMLCKGNIYKYAHTSHEYS